MADGAGITGAFKDELSETFKEVKQQVLSPQGSQKKSGAKPQNSRLAQLAQQDKIESAQKEAAIKKELAMMAHHSASGLGIIRENPKPQPEEEQQKPTMSAPVLPGSKNRNPLDMQLATTKRESRDSKSMG